MDAEKKQRRQSLKVIFSEAIMVLAVVVSVVVLALIVSGYWINSDFKVERQGMLQISSMPAGADVSIDGDTAWLQRTNTSKVLSSGEHTVVLTKEGYDSWTKTINIQEGLLYRLHYPRLFLNQRTAQKMLNLDGITTTSISPDDSIILLTNNTTKWQLLNLTEDKPSSTKLDISKVFSSISLADDAKEGLFTGEIVTADWDLDASHILFEVKTADKKLEWVLLDVKNPEKSLNLTKEFGVDFSTVQILDNSSSNLMGIEKGNLRRVDVSGRSMSAVLAKNVQSFDHYHNEIVFAAESTESDNLIEAMESQKAEGSGESDKSDEELPYFVGNFKLNDDKYTILFKTASPTKAVLSQFYDQKYYTVLEESQVRVYTHDDLEEYAKYDLNFTPEKIKVGHDGEFILMYSGAHIASLDMEANSVREWQAEGESFSWLDFDMLYSVKDGELFVYDFDGLNKRSLAKNVSDHFSVGITDNKWLYYFSDNHLMREWIVEH
ncbi:PEGA domain-containing protein [Candidatus Saccharibacteria bacterium]|nr:PEGA domain-containing protein [Candidatus Saccharibacteria bacterium]